MKSDRFSGKKRYILLFILGMLVFLYPTFSNLYYDYITIGGFPAFPKSPGDPVANVKETAVSDREFQQIESDPEMKLLLNKEIDYLRAYNKKLGNIHGEMADPFGAGDFPQLEDGSYTDGETIFAYIKIPSINQILPVYLGATEEHLKKGAAVIKGTSIPIGGENTNSVIAGHTGLVKKFFTDLPGLKPGDEIIITNAWETLYYKVIGNKLIWPNQEEYLSVVPGKDMITLLTCYHGTTQNDRLLVFAERYHPEEKTEKPQMGTNTEDYAYLSNAELKVKPWYKKPQTIAIGSAVILLGIFIYTFLGRRVE